MGFVVIVVEWIMFWISSEEKFVEEEVVVSVEDDGCCFEFIEKYDYSFDELCIEVIKKCVDLEILS